MGNANYDQLAISRNRGTKDKAKQLARLLTIESEGRAIPMYEAIDLALVEAIERRKEGS